MADASTFCSTVITVEGAIEYALVLKAVRMVFVAMIDYFKIKSCRESNLITIYIFSFCETIIKSIQVLFIFSGDIHDF